MRHHNSLAGILVACAIGATPAMLPSQGAVTGRITITERPGETTNDISSTVVYLVPKDTAVMRARPTRSSLSMAGRAFVPHVRVVTPGSRVDFPNQDPFSHNIFSSTPGQVFDLGLYPAGKSKDALFKKAGAYPVYCNIHPRMTAFVVVTPSPWYAQAGADGRWSIADVPAGQYTLVVWHERVKTLEQPLVVAATGAADLATTLDARGYKFAEHKNKFGREYDRSAVRY